MIQSGMDQGATLVTGGMGLPAGMNRGYCVRPTVFGNVDPSMTIAQEEIFGRVLSIQPYDTIEQALEIANDTVHGLAAYLQTKNAETARHFSTRLGLATSMSTILPETSLLRLEDTSSPEAGANTRNGGLTRLSKSRRCSAKRPRPTKQSAGPCRTGGGGRLGDSTEEREGAKHAYIWKRTGAGS
jgi:hypothetical protein